MGTNLDLSWLVSTGVSGVQQVSVFLSLLSVMRKIRDANTEPAAWREAYGKLFKALDDQAVTPLDGIAAADWDLLKADWTTLRQRLGNHLPDVLQPLTFNLSDIAGKKIGNAKGDGLLEYPVIARTVPGKASIAPGGLAFDVSSSINADAAFSIQVLDKVPDWAKEIGYELPGAMDFVRLGVHGSLAAGAEAAASPAWGKISVSASARAAATLDYCFHYPPSRYLAQVLLDSLPQLRAPGDLAGFLELCKGTSNSAFALSSFDISGGLMFGGSLEIGKALVQQIAIDPQTLKKVSTSLAVSLQPPPTVTAAAGVAIGFNWGIDGDYRTTVRKLGDGAAVRIDRLTGKTTGASLSVSATLDVEGLQAMLDPVMAKVLPSAEPLISRLGELADLRGLVRDTLQKQLGLVGSAGWTEIGKNLVDVATGGDATAASKAIGEKLNTLFTDFANSYLKRIGADPATVKASIEALVTQANELIQATPGASGNAAGGAIANVSSQITTALRAITTRIDQAYSVFTGKVAGASGDVASVIVGAIAPGDAQVGAFIKALQEKANTATGPLVTWLASYEKARTRIAKAVEQVEREKLALSWGVTYQKRRESTALVEVVFVQQPGKDGPTANARALFAALLTGRLENYAVLMDRCAGEKSAKEVQCLFRVGQARSTVYSFSLNLFGFTSITTTSMAGDNVSVAVDGTGRIAAADLTAKFASQIKVDGKVAEASLIIDLEMLAADAAPRLSAIITASGDTFTRKDRDDFFALLERSGAVTAGTNVRVRDLLWGGASNDTTALTHAELSVLYAPDLDAWKRMLKVDPVALEVATRQRCMELLGTAIAVGNERGILDVGTPPSPFAWVAQLIADRQTNEEALWASAKGSPKWSTWYETLFKVSVQSLAATIPQQRRVKRLWQLAHISAGVGTAWKNVAAAEQFLSDLIASPEHRQQAGVADRLASLSDKIVQGFATTVQFETADLAKPTKVSWQFLAPILALAAFGEAEPNPPLITRVKAAVQAQAIDEIVV